MKLRVDLVKKLTEADLMEEILANNHRYKPEPHFSKTGTGTLSSASIEERANEEERSTALIQKLKQRSPKNGSGDGAKRSLSPS
jgi:hypothetical protein